MLAAAECDVPSLTPGLLSAFKFAESVRRELVRGHHYHQFFLYNVQSYVDGCGCVCAGGSSPEAE